MSHATCSFVDISVVTGTALAALLFIGSPRLGAGGDGDQAEMDRFEEKSISRCVERVTKANDTERTRWLRVLNNVLPGKPSAGFSEDDVSQWYDLLTAGGKGWRRDAFESKALAELFDRVAQKLELGPVPSIRRDEFMQFARKAILDKNGEAPKPVDLTPEADRVFRVLDRDGSGILERGEWTGVLGLAANKTDKDGNLRIDSGEYRTYFEARVSTGVERGQAGDAGPGPATRGGSGAPSTSRAKKVPPGTPSWFTELDTDSDGQVALDEWRRGGRPVADFLAMDLDGDGLVPLSEYHRYLAHLKREPDSDAIAEQEARRGGTLPDMREKK